MPRKKTNGDYPRCGRPTSKGTLCTNGAGKGTRHQGRGACHMHGGNDGGAPLGNKNALKTGEYETLHRSTLTDEERAFYDNLDASSLVQAEAQVRLYSLREQRMLLRIRDALEKADATGFEVTRLTTHHGWNVKGKVDFTVSEREAVVNTFLRLDDALGRVQVAKQKAIDHYRQILQDDPPEHDYLGVLAAAIDRSAAKLGITETP